MIGNRIGLRALGLVWLTLVGSCAVLTGPLVTKSMATEVVFTIDPTQSADDMTANDTSAVNPHGAYLATTPGSLSTSLHGNFVVDFDTTGTPTSLSFKGGQGYFQFDSALVGHTSDNQLTLTITQPTAWDFNGTVTQTGGVFPATQNTFTLLSGQLIRTINTAQFPNQSITTTFSPAGGAATPNGGHWTLVQGAPGVWTLSLVDGLYLSTYGAFGTSGTMDHHVHAVAVAHYGTGNLVSVPTAATNAQALGGSSSTGGVSIDFGQPTSGGTFSVQQVPNNTSLNQAAINAATTNPVFALSTDALSVAPQIWTVNYNGTIGAGGATLVFSYDPALLPAGTDQSKLGIWHFDKLANAWEFGGTVNTVNHTITFQANSFSPFELGVLVPEPSSVALAAAGLVALAACAWRRRRRAG